MANTKKRHRGRPSNAEKAAEAEANAVEGNPVLDLKPIEIDEGTFEVHLKAIKSALDKKETAMSLLRTCRKRAKEAGDDILDAVDAALKFERMDQNDVAHQLQILGFALKKTDNPIQLSLYNTLLGDEKEQAYNRGFKDGEAGKTAQNDYPEGSDLAAEYTRGWDHGTAKNLGFSPEETDAIKAGDGMIYNSEPPHSVEPEPAPAAA